MLCEQCQTNEATVHATVVLWGSVDSPQHAFCESCYESAEAEKVRRYNPGGNTPPPRDVENISASEYLEAGARAARNGVDKPAFMFINEQLAHLPGTRERLAFEMLILACRSLDRGEDPGWAAGFAACCAGVIDPRRQPEYVAGLERIILRAFELRKRLENPPGRHGPFVLTLSSMLIALGKVDKARFLTLVAELKHQGGEAELDPRWEVIARAERMVLGLKKGKGDASE